MQFCGTLIAVHDMEKAKVFYTEIMKQEVEMDLGTHVAFKSGLSLQYDYAELVGEKLNPVVKEDNFQLYFEVEDIVSYADKIKAFKGVTLLHDIKEYPWGQHVMRFYDLDKHIVEVSESMITVVKRYLSQGFTVEQTAEKTMFPIEFVKQLI